ncbi:MAG: TlpA disulfide reductase family protein, partial [Candidatus Saccharimonadales bacterium]
IEVYAIESIEPRDELPADAFTVPVPAGTLFVVYDSEQPKHGETTGPVSDAVSFAEAISPRNRSLLPFVERGKPVPRLAVQIWLNQSGIVAAPELANKVVLVDFWGTSCGPCVAELPTLQTIAEKYAETDLLVIGVHDRGAAIGELVEFTKKHGLTYVIGIDGPADEPGWFGASFKAYGVRAIPHAAIIDRHGRLVLIDHLPAVIERIDGELKKQ